MLTACSLSYDADADDTIEHLGDLDQLLRERQDVMEALSRDGFLTFIV